MNTIRPLSVLSHSTTRFSALSGSQSHDMDDLRLAQELKVREANIHSRMKAQPPHVLLKTLEELSKRQEELRLDFGVPEGGKNTRNQARLQRQLELEEQLQIEVENHILKQLKQHGDSVVNTYRCQNPVGPASPVLREVEGHKFLVNPADAHYKNAQERPEGVVDFPSYVLMLQNEIGKLDAYQQDGALWKGLQKLGLQAVENPRSGGLQNLGTLESRQFSFVSRNFFSQMLHSFFSATIGGDDNSDMSEPCVKLNPSLKFNSGMSSPLEKGKHADK